MKITGSGKKSIRRRKSGDAWESAHSLVCSFFKHDELNTKKKHDDPIEKKYVVMHLCHNGKCLNHHHLTYGVRLNNQNMLHLPHLNGGSDHDQIPPFHSHDYYWLVLECMKEVLIGRLHDLKHLKGTGLYTRARDVCRARATHILDTHLEMCCT